MIFKLFKRNQEKDTRTPPCGDIKHFSWADAGWRCPICTSQVRAKQQMRDEDRLAELIANKVVNKLLENKD